MKSDSDFDMNAIPLQRTKEPAEVTLSRLVQLEAKHRLKTISLQGELHQLRRENDKLDADIRRICNERDDYRSKVGEARYTLAEARQELRQLRQRCGYVAEWADRVLREGEGEHQALIDYAIESRAELQEMAKGEGR